MKAFTINQYGSDGKLQITEVAMPVITDNEILVEIHAASINQLDIKIKDGEFKRLIPYKLPLVLGHDFAGVVKKVGSSVSRFQIGDEVFARAADFHIGAFAEYIAVNENDVALKPENISMEAAAAVPLVALTVWQAFVEMANLKKGQKVFIQAGSGGVGSLAIQMAKHFGATVATTTSKGNFEMVRKLGANVLIDYKTQNFETVLEDYDLVLHSQDTKNLEKSFKILKPGGKIISISGPPDKGFAEKAGLSWLMRAIISILSRKTRKLSKKYNVEYSFLFMYADGKQLSEIAKLIESGAIYPVIDSIYDFEHTNDAMSYVQSGRAKGKVVLKIK